MRLLPLLILTSCGSCPHAPPTPVWDEDCVPSDDAYLRLARSDEHRPAPLPAGRPLSELRADAEAEAEHLGFTLRIGRPPGWDWIANPDDPFCATTVPPHVWISRECADRKGDDNAAWLELWRHELVHMRQWQAYGPLMPLYYGVTEGRLLAIEGPAYAETFATRRALEREVTDADLEERARRVYRQYQGHRAMPERCYVQHAVEGWR